MACAKNHHAAPLGLGNRLIGLGYFKHVAPIGAGRRGPVVIMRRLVGTLKSAGPTVLLITTVHQLKNSLFPGLLSPAACRFQHWQASISIDSCFGLLFVHPLHGGFLALIT
jgi:hypothetical protein